LAPMVPLVLLVIEERLACLDPQALLDLGELQVHKVNEETLELPAKKDLLVRLVFQDLMDLLGLEEREAKKVRWEKKDNLAWPADLETKDHLAQRDQWDLQVHPDCLVLLDKLDPWDRLDSEESEEKVDLRVSLDLLA